LLQGGFPARSDCAWPHFCCKNGALPRDTVRDIYSEKSWKKFSQQIESRPAGNNGLLGFYFPLKEIIPDGVEGEYFFSDGERISPNEFPPDAHARAVVESQLLSVRARLIDTLHGTAQGKPSEGDAQTYASAAGLKRWIITGGGSRNHVLQQLAADILGLPVFTATSGSDSAVSGGALLAKYAWWKRNVENSAAATHGVQPNNGEEGTSPSSTKRSGTSFEDMRKEFGGPVLELVAETDASNEHLYGSMLGVFRRCEQVIVNDFRRK
jgi:xylulokinase